MVTCVSFLSACLFLTCFTSCMIVYSMVWITEDRVCDPSMLHIESHIKLYIVPLKTVCLCAALGVAQRFLMSRHGKPWPLQSLQEDPGPGSRAFGAPFTGPRSSCKDPRAGFLHQDIGIFGLSSKAPPLRSALSWLHWNDDELLTVVVDRWFLGADHG